MADLKFDQLKEYLKGQGVKDSEIKYIVENWKCTTAELYPEECWRVTRFEDGEAWFNEMMDSIAEECGSIGEFLKLHFLDWEEFIPAYSDFLTDDGVVTAIYCPDTKRVVFFSGEN
jgi:hypothetical protein